MTRLPKPTEGYTTPQQRQHILYLISMYAPTSKYILDLGFNAGHSSDSFLRYIPDSTVVSFDIGLHPYVQTGKTVIDEMFPGRHTLIIGNSVETIPAFEGRKPFDVILIDGGHAYETVQADLENCRRLAGSHTLLFIDDVVHSPKWSQKHNKGPTRAWTEVVQSQFITELGHHDYAWGRGMSWGRYNF